MQDGPSKEFVTEITAVQRPLYGFVRTLAGTNFAAWACRVAWFKVLDYRRSQKVRRLRFADTLVETLVRAFLHAIVQTAAFQTK